MYDRSSPFATAAPPGPSSKGSVALQVLRHALLSCEIPPGAAFAEAEVEARYRVGRASVRAALASLAGEGLVTALPRQGWRAAPISGTLIGSLIGARRLLEPCLADRALSAGEVTRLETLVGLETALIGRDDPQAIVTARVTDRQIMDILGEGVGHFRRKWLTEIWDHAGRIQHFLERSGPGYRPAGRERLIGALKANDRAAASREILEDIARFEAFVADALLRRPEALQGSEAKASARRVRRRPRSATKSSAHATSDPTRNS